jgi:hypothetical protein
LHVIAGIDVPARDDAVNLGDDVTIAKVQLSLSELLVGGLEFSLGLFDGRSVHRKSIERAVNVALSFELL